MIWYFEDFEIDDARFELRRGGGRVSIAPKPLALLLHLARRHPATVSGDELLRTLWPDVRVTAASLARAVLAARRALGAVGGEEGLIRTVRGRGYALAETIAPSPAEAGSMATDAPFVGRVSELARIEAALDNVAVGRGRVLCIVGEPGIGKSRLLEELAARARERGAAVVAGHCREDEGAPPYWPWSEILRGFPLDSADLRAHSFLVPLIADRAPPDAEPSEGGAELNAADTRFRLFQDVAEAIRRAARERPLVVLIEDLHWAAPGTLHLLRFAARSLANAHALIALTYRSVGPPPNQILESTIGELGSLSHAAQELRLDAFSSDEIASYVRHVIGRPADPILLGRLQEAAGGNPLFLRALVPILAAAGANGTSMQLEAVPPTIGHVVRSQLARLSPPAQELVEIAAVVGRVFTPQVLARAAHRRLETVLARLREASAHGLIGGEASNGFHFRHDVLRGALYSGLGDARRADLHRRVARAIEAGENPQAQLGELSHHFGEALRIAGPDKAIHYARRAAEAARAASDFDGAAHYYRRALTALRGARAADSRERFDLQLRLGEVLELTGQLTQSRQAILEAADIARTLGSFTRLADTALAITAWQQAVLTDPATVQLVQDALHAVEKRRPALRARLLAKLAVLRKVEGRDADAAELIEQALVLARRLRGLPLLCDVLVDQLLVRQFGIPGDHAARLALTDELLDIAARAKRTYATLQCRRHRISLFLDSGAGEEFDREIEHFARESAAARSKQHYVAGFRATKAIVRGQFEEARLAIDEAQNLADPLSTEEYRFTPTGQRVLLPSEYRDTEALADSIAELLRDFPQITTWYGSQAMVALALGRTDTARANVERLAADDFALVPHDHTYVITLATIAQLVWSLGERRFARPLYDCLLPHAGAQVSAGFGMVYLGPVDWFLGVLASMLGLRWEAARHFDVALVSSERLRAWPWHARTQLDYASLLADGNAAERTRARDLASSAAGFAERMGMPEVRANAVRLTAALVGKLRPGRR